MIGAALMAREPDGRERPGGSSSARRRSGTSRTSRCACSPRCATADVVACEDTRRTGVLLERYGVQATLVPYHEHNERERTPELVERMRGRRGRRAGVATRGCRSCPTRATCSCRAASRRGSRSRCCRGRRRRWPRWWRRRCRRTCGGSSGSCRASGRGWSRSFGSAETVVAFESPQRVAASLAVLAELDPARPGGGLPRADEAARGGRAGDGGRAGGALRGGGAARRGRARRRRGAARGRGCDEAAVDAVRRLVESGARARVAAGVVAELTGAPANALYKAVAER